MKINYYVFWIGLKYFFVKRKNNFGALIAVISMVGIALGVAVLITVLSVMNGFSKEIRNKILNINPHITLKSFFGELHDWRKITSILEQHKEITGVSPYIAQHGLLIYNGNSRPIINIGIDLAKIQHIYPLENNIIHGSIQNLIDYKYKCLIGKDLADSLGLKLNDQIALMIPQVNISPVGVNPKIKQLTVGGILNSGTNYDQNHMFLKIEDLNTIYKMHNGITGIQLKVKDDLRAHAIAAEISKQFEHKYLVTDWTTEFKSLFDAMQMEKTVMTCILLLIIAVAAFNLISSLIMLVMDKRSDIAILRVMGASKTDIIWIFILQGLLVGAIGTVLGVIFGLILASNATALVNWLQRILDVKFISEEAYLIGFLPSEIHANDVIWVIIIALLMSFIATLYPAYRASNVKPAEALHYE